MRSCLILSLAVVFGCGSEAARPDAAANFSFFITSAGNPSGGDFRRTPADADGLAGADEFCRSKAAAGAPASANRMWRAYLSTDKVNAKDRIGSGPWFNYAGVMVAASVSALHDPMMNQIGKTTGLDETGGMVPGAGDNPNQHDIVTGTNADGTASAGTCANWTSAATTGFVAVVGHFDRTGGGADPTSWNSAHPSQGCAAASFPPTGGRGSIYCFAAD
jgi:hypothetical protein